MQEQAGIWGGGACRGWRTHFGGSLIKMQPRGGSNGKYEENWDIQVMGAQHLQQGLWRHQRFHHTDRSNECWEVSIGKHVSAWQLSRGWGEDNPSQSIIRNSQYLAKYQQKSQKPGQECATVKTIARIKSKGAQSHILKFFLAREANLCTV